MKIEAAGILRTHSHSLKILDYLQKQKAGQICPAFRTGKTVQFAWLSWISFRLTSVYFELRFVYPLPDRVSPQDRIANYITSAKLSNSRSRTGRAQPAISTRPAASMAAWGETP